MDNGRWMIVFLGLAGVLENFNDNEPGYIYLTTIILFTVLFFLHPYAGLFAKTPWYKLIGSLLIIIILMTIVFTYMFL